MSERALFPASEAGGIDLALPTTSRLGYDPDDMLRTAYLSDEVPVPRYRWSLHRRFGPGQILTFIMLNPSTADALGDDPTIVKCLGFASRLGFGAPRWRCNANPGPRRPIGHDRLMSTVQPAPDTREAPCPICGAPSKGRASRQGRIVYAHFLCAAGHLWAAHWLTEQDGAA